MEDTELRKRLRVALAGFVGVNLTPEVKALAHEALRVELRKLQPDWQGWEAVAVPQPGDIERGILRFDIRPLEN